jgi:hypothetical protein
MIPTKNRYETLLPVLQAFIKNIEGDNFEIVVQDNSDNNQAFTDWFEKFHDEKIKYFYEPRKLDIVQNTIKALEHCNGEYLIFIGDDDFVSPYIVKIVEFIKEKGIDCLMYSLGYYWWSSVVFIKETDYLKRETYWEPLNINAELIKMDSANELNYVLTHGGTTYYQLPRFYHGLVKREVLEKIKKQTGVYLSGICPDIGFSTSLSLVIKNYYFINYPISVAGASKNSGGGWTTSNTHYGKIGDMEFLPADASKRWDPLLPKIWSAQITNSQTIYDVFKTFDINRSINYEEFYALMLTREPMLNQYTKISIKQYCNNNIMKYIGIYFKFIRYFLKKSMMSYVHIIRYKTGRFKFKILNDILVEDIMPLLSKIDFNNKADINANL